MFSVFPIVKVRASGGKDEITFKVQEFTHYFLSLCEEQTGKTGSLFLAIDWLLIKLLRLLIILRHNLLLNLWLIILLLSIVLWLLLRLNILV